MIQNLNIEQHFNMTRGLRVGEIIGHANYLRAFCDDMKPTWDLAREVTSGDHLIENVVYNNNRKEQALMDYAMVFLDRFINAPDVSLSTHNQRSVQLSDETRKAILYRLASITFKTPEDLFRKLATELLGFDTYLVNFALCKPEERPRMFTWAYESIVGNLRAESDWDALCEDIVEALIGFDLFGQREEIVNAYLEEAINAPSDIVFDVNTVLISVINKVKAGRAEA